MRVSREILAETEIPRGCRKGRLYLILHCHHQKKILHYKMGEDECRFQNNVSLIVRDKVTRECPQTTNFEERGESPREAKIMIMVATIMRIVVIIDFDDGENNAEGDGNSDGDDDDDDAFGEDDDIGDDDGRCERVFPGPDTVPTAV